MPNVARTIGTTRVVVSQANIAVVAHVTDTDIIRVVKQNNVTQINRNIKVVNSKAAMGLDTNRFRYNQLPVETPDGANTVFTLPNSESYVLGYLDIFIDGLKQTKDVDWEETTNETFTMLIIVDADETLTIGYIRKI